MLSAPATVSRSSSKTSAYTSKVMAALACPSDPNRGVLTQIVEESTPPGLHQIVDRIDAIVHEVAYTGWTSSGSGDKSVRRELRAVLKNYGLPIKGDLFDRTYQYVRENY